MKIKLLVIATLLSFMQSKAFAEDSQNTINLGKLYNKFRESMKQSTADEVMWNDFDNAIKKGEPPKKIFAYAKKGNPKACNYVGYLFYHGKGVKQDNTKALRWFEYCAKTNPKAAYNAGIMYAEGIGTEKNMDKAEPYLKLAWKGLEIPQAGIRLAYYYKSKQDWRNEWEWLEKLAAVEKYPKHWGYLMGEMILKKRAPIYDPYKANIVLTKAMEQSSAPAADLLAYSLGNGLAGQKSEIQACQVEIYSEEFSGKPSTKYWMNKLEEHEQRECLINAKKWLDNNKSSVKIDFKSLLY